MAFHYITPGQCHLPSLLLTFLLCLSAYRIVAVTTTPDVTNVITSNVNESSFTLSWTSPSNGSITEYRVVSVFSNGTLFKNETTTNPTYTATGLPPGITYIVTIYAVNNNGSSSGVTQSVTTLPSSVSNFSAATVGTDQINLTWTISLDDNAKTYTYLIFVQPGSYVTSGSNFRLVTLLSPGSNYTFTIFTVTQNGVRSSKPQTTLGTTKPSAVNNTKVTSVTVNSVTLQWTSSSDPNSGSYTYTVNNGTSNIKTLIPTNTTVIAGLTPGTDYNFTVFAVTPNGVYSPASNAVNATTQPSPATNLKVTSALVSSVTLQWDFSSDTGSSSYTYTVNNGTSNIQTGLKTNTAVIQGLTPGTNYTFTVSAVTSNGVYSTASNTVHATTQPSPVNSLKATSVSVNSVNLQWAFSSDSSNSSYTYTVNNGTSNILTGLKTNTAVIQGLTSGTNYTFTVFAVTPNEVYSPASNPVYATTQPSAVKNVSVTSVSVKSVSLHWDFSSDSSNSSYTYTVYNGTSNILTGLKTNTALIQGLTPGTNYTFTVFAVTPNGVYSPASNPVHATTQPSVVTNLKVTSVSVHSVTLQWTSSSDSGSSSYTYTVSDGTSNIQTGLQKNTTVIDSLTPGTNYTFTVFAVTPNGVYSTASNTVDATTQPSAVTNLMVTSVTVHSVSLHWDFSSDPNSSLYTYTVSNGTSNIQTGLHTNNTLIEGLPPGTNYNFAVFAVTPNGVYSPSSNITNATTQPSNVTNLKVTSVSVNSVTLQWTSSSDPHNSTYTYTVYNGTSNIKTLIQTNTAKIDGLEPGMDYNFTVFAVTQNGIYSPASNIVNATTRPSAVTAFQVSNRSNDTVILTWTFPTDRNVATYTYYVKVDDQRQLSTPTNSTEVGGLSAGVVYNFTIYTVTRNGIWSQQNPVIINRTRPNPPINLQANAVNISVIRINWTAPNDVNEQYYNYHVTWVDKQNSQSAKSATTMDKYLDIKELLPGHLYTITIISEIDNTESVTAQLDQATRSLTPQQIANSNVTNSSITLTWNIPDDPSSTLNGYRITVYLNGTISSQTETSERVYVVNDLIPGSVYNIHVQSFVRYPKPGILIRMSTTDNFIYTYSDPEIIVVETVPNPVQGLSCSKVDAYQISVTFNCPGGGFTTLQLYVNNKARNRVDSCPGKVTVSNLQPAGTYEISVETVAKANNISTEIKLCYTDNTGVIVGSIFGVLLFILLIAVIIFLVMRKRRLKDPNENIPTTTTRTRRFHTIPKDKFRHHYENNHADSDFGFAEEYQELNSVGTTQSKRAAELTDNRSKNRFTNVLPYDHSRVKLSAINGIPTSDYINANYMPGYNSTKEFIASQGPLPNTTADFWRMIWEHQVNTIVMLTNCVENGRVKCEHYWPLDYTPCTYGDLTVTVTSETILSEWTVRDFSVKHANQPGVKYVRHFHFTAWPDHGVPDSTESIVQFRNLVREHMDQRKSNGPTVVHCSAGVGRTGTLIALDYLIQQIEREQRIGIYGFVEKMRMNRNLMVQTEAQYIFLNKCMLDLIDQPEDEHIYENNTGTELVYENMSAIRSFQNENA